VFNLIRGHSSQLAYDPATNLTLIPRELTIAAAAASPYARAATETVSIGRGVSPQHSATWRIFPIARVDWSGLIRVKRFSTYSHDVH